MSAIFMTISSLHVIHQVGKTVGNERGLLNGVLICHKVKREVMDRFRKFCLATDQQRLSLTKLLIQSCCVIGTLYVLVELCNTICVVPHN